ncbi:Calx-beta domain-containing protein [uncultured Aquimarina sp.]|uniref:DUF7933 domain-containing protein n=1 Tax=uncultured Aquimarina sp. TaxID=575652 RepID=UPI002635D0FE|nr:Calx-beta domain-containing protein [uncultured Aquimarina sp.]
MKKLKTNILYFLLLSVVLTINHALGQDTFIDDFAPVAYNNNDNGNQNWGSNWIENNETTNPTAGRVFIHSPAFGFGPAFAALDNTLTFFNLDGRSIRRDLDLSAYSNVTLTLDYDSRFRGNETLLVELFNNALGDYETVATINTTEINSIPIVNLTPNQISANSSIRFSGADNNWGNEAITVDNIVFTATLAGPRISINDATVNENAGTVNFTVNHIGTNATGPFTVDVNTINNTAFAGSDFNLITNTLSFSGTSGDSQNISISITDDLDIEIDEDFSISFSNPSDPSVDVSDQAVITITDNETDNPRPYEERFAINLRGNFDMIGNTNLTCTANCASPVANNPPVVMGYTSIDGSTINSSSSNLSLPAGATVSWAGLYWGGTYSSSFAGINNPDPSILRTDQVRFRVPSSGTYSTVTADVSNYENSSFNGWAVFQSFADVTSLVQGAGSGTYTIADIALTTGSAFTGPFGGWTMVIVYENPADLTRSVNIWDGFDFFGFGANDSFTLTGLLTPSAGAFDTKTGYFGMDGEAGAAFVGDFVAINGTALSNALNPANNTLNSTISTFGIDTGTRNPNQSYNWGLDIDIFDSSGLIPNNATTATVDLGSANEGIWGGVFANSTQVAFPTVASKSFSPVQINYGEESTVTIQFSNPSDGVDLTSLSLTDNLPSGMNISTTPDATSSCGGTITAVSGSNSFSISGINLNAGNSCTFTFDVIGTQVGALDNTISSSDISNDQNIPLAGTTTGTLNVIVKTVITNRRITYRVKPN